MRRRLLLVCLILLLVPLGVVTFVMTSQSGFPEEIRRVEGVSQVDRPVSPWHPARCIIHIADFHLISRDDYGTYLRDEEPGISDEEIEQEFLALKAAVRRVQANQLRLIRWLAREHGVRVVHLEGLADQGKDTYAAMLRLARQGTVDPAVISAAGQALLDGDIEMVAPAEEETPYQAAERLAGGHLRLEGPENDAREEAMVRRLADSGPLSVVVLGVEHDLSRHVRKLGDCEYLKVYVEGFR